jgi:hypothetical protein
MRIDVTGPDGRPVRAGTWQDAAAGLAVTMPGAKRVRRFADGNGVLAVMTSHNPKDST